MTDNLSLRRITYNSLLRSQLCLLKMIQDLTRSFPPSIRSIERTLDCLWWAWAKAVLSRRMRGLPVTILTSKYLCKFLNLPEPQSYNSMCPTVNIQWSLCLAKYPTRAADITFASFLTAKRLKSNSTATNPTLQSRSLSTKVLGNPWKALGAGQASILGILKTKVLSQILLLSLWWHHISWILLSTNLKRFSNRKLLKPWWKQLELLSKSLLRCQKIKDSSRKQPLIMKIML